MEHWNNPAPLHQQDDFFDVVKTSPMLSRTSIVTSISDNNALTQIPLPSVPSSYDTEALNSLKMGMAKMMSAMDRLEQRLNRVEQTTSQILKNQQEVLQVPFISQSELDTARKAAEQLEQDTAVAKQLQAAYNKEVEVRKSSSSFQYHTPTPNHSMNQIGQCPICGSRMMSNGELEAHVEKCLDQFSSDPKKELAVQDTKKKMETGFFGRTFGIKSTKTTETKVISSPATAPSMDHDGMMVNPNNYYPPQAFGYPMMMHPQMQHQMMAPPNGYWPSYNGYPTMGNSINNSE